MTSTLVRPAPIPVAENLRPNLCTAIAQRAYFRPGSIQIGCDNVYKSKIGQVEDDDAMHEIGTHERNSDGATSDGSEDSNDDENFEKAYIIGMLLSIKMGEYSRQNPTPGSNKSLRITVEKASKLYDRLLLFADTKSGDCFYFMCTTKQQAKAMFQPLQGKDAIGRLFVLLQPYVTSEKIGGENGVVCIKHVAYVYPMKPVCAKYMPTVELVDARLGETKHFCRHKIKIRVCNVLIATACCGGKLCDRQHINFADNKSFRCGCFSTDQTSKYVLEMSVKIPCCVSLHPKKKMMVHFTRSLRTTNIFLKPDKWNEIKQGDPFLNAKLGQTVSEIVAYINNHGGWTVLGWHKKGHQTDDSDLRDNEKLESDDVKPHIIYLYPTDTGIMTTEQFRNLQWPKADDIETNANQNQQPGQNQNQLQHQDEQMEPDEQQVERPEREQEPQLPNVPANGQLDQEHGNQNQQQTQQQDRTRHSNRSRRQSQHRR